MGIHLYINHFAIASIPVSPAQADFVSERINWRLPICVPPSGE
jgi:hypothetical protein